jgi:hypothetical protein
MMKKGTRDAQDTVRNVFKADFDSGGDDFWSDAVHCVFDAKTTRKKQKGTTSCAGAKYVARTYIFTIVVLTFK